MFVIATVLVAIADRLPRRSGTSRRRPGGGDRARIARTGGGWCRAPQDWTFHMSAVLQTLAGPAICLFLPDSCEGSTNSASKCCKMAQR